jgi:hypothetical protein
VAADVLAQAEQLAVRREQPGRVEAPRQREGRLRLAEPLGQRRHHGEGHRELALDPRSVDGDRLERALAADPA